MISGKLVADFSSVPAEAEKAVVALGQIGAAAGNVTKSLDTIREPAGLRPIGESGAFTTQAMTGLSGALKQSDAALSAMGIHLGPEIRALDELGAASGKTASQLGLVATAGLAVAAATAGWGVGRSLAEFIGSDKIIGDATAKLLGWGDAAGEAAAAKTDVLARATKNAGREITDYTEAMAINLAAAQKQIAVTTDFRAELARATTAAHGLTSAQRDLIHAGLDLGKSDKEIEEQLHITEATLNVLKQAWQDEGAAAKKALDDQAKAEADHNKQFAEGADVLTKLMADSLAQQVRLHGSAEEQERAQITATEQHDINALQNRKLSEQDYATAVTLIRQMAKKDLDALADKYRALALAALEAGRSAVEAEDAAAAAAKRHNDELDRQRKTLEAAAAAEAAKMHLGGSVEFDFSTPEGRAHVPADIANWLHLGYSLAQAARLAAAMGAQGWGAVFQIINDPINNPPGPRVPGFAGGVENFSGGLAMVGERGPELVNLPGGSDVIPLGRGTTVNVNIRVNGVLDPRTIGDLSRSVSQHITRSILQGGKLTAH